MHFSARTSLISAAVACLLFAAGIAVADEKGPNQDSPVNARSETAKTLQQLGHLIDQWHSAILRGNGAEGERHEHSILLIVRADIDANRRLLSKSAREVALNNADGDRNANEVSDTDKDASRQFRRSRKLLERKEQILESLSRANAFSNKYRLISDYIALLRGQLSDNGKTLVWRASDDDDLVK